MELDDLESAWASLEASNVAVLRELKLDRARSALVPSQLARVVELVLGISALLLCVPVVGSHLASWRYLAFGVPSVVYMAVATGHSAYLLVRMRQLSFDGALLSIQREVAELRRVELRATLVALLGGVILWLPVGLLLFEAVSGAPLLGAVDLAWLVANIAFGVVVLAVARVFARRLTPDGPRTRRIVDALTGRGFRAVESSLAQLGQF